ncbi:hypothetical protein [Ottowia sp. VDI28]|uniref:hypothetical protein n=1 Tax=Ottowia sp. VDI28 TaxID=3133968 RepID=UPI003C2B0A85
MDRYAAENAREKIAGYMISKHPSESPDAYFERAKDECLKHMRIDIENVAAMDFAQFIAAAKHKNTALAAEAD